jgi:hypothetical protein
MYKVFKWIKHWFLCTSKSGYVSYEYIQDEVELPFEIGGES